ncbi:hypothetical protein J4212_04560 [Candidatus Woesearchaeota archaeon]|nr:hypothetical protein [Candidatus Woesearchaeota archaeon]
MNPSKFSEIKSEYDNFYRSLMAQGKLPLWSTGHGFWSNAISEEVYEAFKKIGLHGHRTFIDLGSGDGKVVLIAALFCQRAVGIEGDNVLHQKALEMQKKLLIPNAIFFNDDFYNHNILDYDIVFTYPDAPMYRGMEKKFLSELSGKLLHYGHHFHPEQLEKEDSFMVNGSPFTIYRNPK